MVFDEAFVKPILRQYAPFSYSVDLGCGTGQDWLKKYTRYLVGVDVNPTAYLSLQLGYDEVKIEDIRTYEIPDECDSVFMFDVIEHITKEEGYELLNRIGNRFIMLTTPQRFYDSLITHYSLWREEELESLGFNIKLISRGGFCGSLIERYFGKCILAWKE